MVQDRVTGWRWWYRRGPNLPWIALAGWIMAGGGGCTHEEIKQILGGDVVGEVLHE